MGNNLEKELKPFYKMYVPKRLVKEKDLFKRVNKKQVSFDMAEIYRADINRYIPADSGNLREKGYVLQLSNSKINPWFKLIYRNTKDVPYTMYQYEGKVWRPNFAIFSGEAEGFNKFDLKLREARIKYHFEGWVSSKKCPRSKTPLNFRRKKVVRYLGKGKNKKRFTIYGYKNKESQPEWIQYAEKHSKGLGSYKEEIPRYIESVYKSALEAQRLEEEKRAAKKQRALAAQRRKQLERLLGVKDITKVRTRLRKKNRG